MGKKKNPFDSTHGVYNLAALKLQAANNKVREDQNNKELSDNIASIQEGFEKGYRVIKSD